MIIIVVAAICLLGVALGLYYSSLPAHHPQKNRKNCESVGGEWSEAQSVCLLSNKQAGEACTDGGQCQSGICSPRALTEQQITALDDGPIKNIIGTCSSDNIATGCVEQVVRGEISKKSLCLDD
jgi:hypothetical protein